MSRKWTNEEVEMLMESVGKNNCCLTSALIASKTKNARKKWAEITSSTNSSEDGPLLKVDQEKQKIV